MEKDKIFFGDKGLTSTSANHIANMAKEMYENIEKQLNNPLFYSTTVSCINSDAFKVVANGKDKKFLDGVERNINDIAELKSLIAWLREAIKAREHMINEMKAFSFSEYCKKMEVEIPEVERLATPKREKSMTEADYYAKLSVGERNHYYELETKAAVIGKYIHENGAFSKQRTELVDRIEKPSIVMGDNANALIYTYIPSVTVDEVNDVFFRLQTLYRGYQAELNSMKFACEKACREDEVRCDTEYQVALETWQTEMSLRNSEVNRIIDKVSEEWKMYVKAENERISNLKIIIPDSLKAIYEKVNQIGKEK